MVLDRGIGTTLRDGRGSTAAGARVRGALVAIQVGVTVVLLVGAGLMVRSFAALTAVDPGFDVEGGLTVTVDLDWARYTDGQSRRDFFDQLLTTLGDRPGIESVAVAGDFPMSGTTFQSQAGLDLEGRPRDPGVYAPTVGLRTVSEGYFETLGIDLVAGRSFRNGDAADADPVAVVSRSLADRHLGRGDPVGRRLSIDGGHTWMTVVGVADDVLQSGPDAEAGEDLYRPFRQGGGVRRILVKTRGEPSGMVRPVTEAVLALDPRQPVSFVQTLAEARDERVASPRTITGLLTVFGLVALVTAAGGLFGVVAWSVQQQRRETGIRLALGEARGAILARTFRRGLTLVGAGLLVGLAVAFFAVRAVERFLFGVAPLDPTTWVGVCLVLTVVAVAAIAGPAVRGTRVSPMRVLRVE